MKTEEGISGTLKEFDVQKQMPKGMKLKKEIDLIPLQVGEKNNVPTF